MKSVPRSVVRGVAPLTDPEFDSATDGELLGRFRRAADDRAFAELVRRHERAVVAACRQVLASAADVDDAVQATFVTLVRHAGRVRPDRGLSGWLFAVAHRIAVRAVRAKTRRTRREAAAPSTRPTPEPLAELSWREATAAVHDEIDKLPDRHRLPLILCYLDGLSRDEAAAKLGWKAWSVKAGLERGRDRLRAALGRRGITLTAGLLAVLVGGVGSSTGRAASPRLLEPILAAVSGAPSPSVAALARGIAVNTWAKPLGLVVGVVAVGAFALGLVGGVRPPSANADEKPAMKDERKPDAKKDAKPEKPTSVGGTVVGPDGQPVDGATVFVGYSPSGWLATGDERGAAVKVATTDKDGKFKADVPKEVPPHFGVFATKPGYGVAWEEPKYPTPVLENADKLALKLTKDQPIRGRVVDTEGKPVVGAVVGVLDVIEPLNGDLDKLLKGSADGGFGQVGQWEKVLWVPRAVAGTTTDKDGKFEITGLGADRVVGLAVSGKGLARMSGFIFTRTGVDVDPLNKQAGGGGRRTTIQHPVFYGPSPTFVTEPGYAVVGTVTSKKTGKPVPDCQVEVNTGYWDHTVTSTDKDGKYRLDGLAKGGDHWVHVYAPEKAEVFSTWADVKPPDGFASVTLDFALSPGAVFAGKAIDKETRQPVAAEFQIIPSADNNYAKLPEYETASRDMTWKGGGPDGKFRIVTLPGPSAVNVTVNPTETLYGRPFNPYRAGQKLTIDLKEDGNAEFTVELDRGKAVTLTAADVDEKPVSGVVTCGQTVQDEGFLVEAHTFKLPADESKFTVYGLGDKDIRRVVVIQPDKKLGGSRLVTPASQGALTLRPLQPVRGTFTDADGTPLAGLTVSIEYEASGVREMFRDHAPKWVMTTTTDKDGKFEIPDVIPGLPFSFDAHKGSTYYRGAPQRLGTQTVTAGKPLELGVRKLEEVRD